MWIVHKGREGQHTYAFSGAQGRPVQEVGVIGGRDRGLSPSPSEEKLAFLADEVAAKPGSVADEVVFELGCGK